MKKETETLEFAAILVGVLFGVFLAYFYNILLLTKFDLQSLIVFLTIPLLSGFITGVIDRSHAIRNGCLVGSLTGTLNFIMSLAVFVSEKIQSTSSENLFLIISIFTWIILSATGARLGKDLKS